MRIFIVLLITGLLFGTALAAEEEQAPFVAPLGDDGVQRVEITGGEYYFEPSHIIVKVNVPVEFTVKKKSRFVPHDIVVSAPEAGMDFRVDFGREGEVIRFTPTKTGSYPFYCDKKFLFFKSHREKGMEGTLEVVE